MQEVMKIPNWAYKHPLNVHILITDECNLNCPKCFYKPNQGYKISSYTMNRLFEEWVGKVTSIAIGGGEPLLYEGIEKICEKAKLCKFFVAITTNGTIRKKVSADRIHVSFDEIHNTDFEQTRQSIKFFREFTPKVGLNHILTDMKSLKKALKLPVDAITLLAEKPIGNIEFSLWEEATKFIPQSKLWIDACIAQKLGLRKCQQGITSMSLNQRMMASRCSNGGIHIPYTNLESTWRDVQRLSPCPLSFGYKT